MVSGGMRRQGAASSSEGASLLRIWEARQVLRKCTSAVVGHNSKISYAYTLEFVRINYALPNPPPIPKLNQIS